VRSDRDRAGSVHEQALGRAAREGPPDRAAVGRAHNEEVAAPVAGEVVQPDGRCHAGRGDDDQPVALGELPARLPGLRPQPGQVFAEQPLRLPVVAREGMIALGHEGGDHARIGGGGES
jgi:hypothetical protein